MTPVDFQQRRPVKGMSSQELLSLLCDQRRVWNGTALASAARTTTTVSSILTNHEANSLIAMLRISAASGTGGLRVILEAWDPLSSNGYWMNADATYITATGVYAYLFSPNLSVLLNARATVVQGCTTIIPYQFYLRVNVGDASSYTYSLHYALIP